MSTTPEQELIAVFASDEELLAAVRRVQATLEFEGLRMTPEEEAALVKALREGKTEEECADEEYRKQFFSEQG